MSKFSLAALIAILCLAGQSRLSYAQERSFAPYFGISGSLDTNGDPGWGIEGGTRFFNFYAGLEYGTYSNSRGNLTEIDPVPGAVPPPFPISSEAFWGIHTGYVINETFYVGIVLLKSYESWESSTNYTTSYTEKRSYLNIGPDFRYSGIDNGHLYLALALTIRRGLKVGLGYMF